MRQPQDDLFSKSRQVHLAQCDGGYQLDGKVTIAHCIEAVVGHTVEAQLGSDTLAIQGKRGCGQCTRSERTLVRPARRVAETTAVSSQHLLVCQKMVANANRLCTLQVGVARHDVVDVLFCQVDKCTPEVVDSGDELLGGGARV